MIGMKKHSDLPDPVPVVTTKLLILVVEDDGLGLMVRSWTLENDAARRMKEPLLHELSDRGAVLETRINLKGRLRPETLRCIFGIDLRLDVGSGNPRKRA